MLPQTQRTTVVATNMNKILRQYLLESNVENTLQCNSVQPSKHTLPAVLEVSELLGITLLEMFCYNRHLGVCR